MTSTALHASTAGAGTPAAVVDPSVFSWANPTLGTSLNGPRWSETLANSVALLRARLVHFGWRVAEEVTTNAALGRDSTTCAYRVALADVFDAAADEVPCFQVGARIVAQIEEGETRPSFRLRLVAQRLDGEAFLLGEPLGPRGNASNWVQDFSSQLTTAVNP